MVVVTAKTSIVCASSFRIRSGPVPPSSTIPLNRRLDNERAICLREPGVQKSFGSSVDRLSLIGVEAYRHDAIAFRKNDLRFLVPPITSTARGIPSQVRCDLGREV